MNRFSAMSSPRWSVGLAGMRLSRLAFAKRYAVPTRLFVSGPRKRQLISHQLFTLLLALFSQNTANTDWTSITTLWIQANDQEGCALQLMKLLNDEELPELYQIAFDLAEAGSQAFVRSVRDKLKEASMGPKEGLASYTIADGISDMQLIHRMRTILASSSIKFFSASGLPNSSSTSCRRTIRRTRRS